MFTVTPKRMEFQTRKFHLLSPIFQADLSMHWLLLAVAVFHAPILRIQSSLHSLHMGSSLEISIFYTTYRSLSKVQVNVVSVPFLTSSQKSANPSKFSFFYKYQTWKFTELPRPKVSFICLKLCCYKQNYTLVLNKFKSTS